MHFHIITLFPDALRCYLDESILGRAQEAGKVKISYYNPRDFTKDKHRRVDQRPYGGGPGMVLAAEPVLAAAQKAIGKKKDVKVLFLSAGGKQFDSKMAKGLAKKYKHIVLIAGHYEGVDARVKKVLRAQELSIGPYTLTGGEVPAMAVVDAVSRFVPGVLGNERSREEERVAAHEVYTRPEELRWGKKSYRVPSVLLSGHHKNIEEWKKGRNKRS